MGNYSVCIIDKNDVKHFNGTSFSAVSLPQKHSYCGTFISVNDIASYAFQLPLDTSEESFAIKVERAFYKDGGLDANENYIVTYKRSKTQNESWYIEAFAVKESKLTEEFEKFANKNKGAIDLVAVPYCVYEALYIESIIPKESVDIFIHYHIDYTFAAMYKNGSFLAFRQFPSLRTLAKRWRLDVSFLVDALSQWGLKKELYPEDQFTLYTAFEKQLQDMLVKIQDLLRHKGGMFGILSADKVYLDFMRLDIPGLQDMATEMGFYDTEISTLLCCEDIDVNEQSKFIEGLYIAQASVGLVDVPNLSIFERQPPFYYTHTGALTMIAIVAASIVLVSGLLLEYKEDLLKKEKSTLLSKLKHKEETRDKKLIIVADFKKKKDLVQKSLNVEERIINGWIEVSHLVLDSKKSVRMRRKLMHDVNNALAKHRLKALSLTEYGDQNLSVTIYSTEKEREKIAEFMKDIKSDGYSSVDTQLVSRDGGLYKSLVEILQ